MRVARVATAAVILLAASCSSSDGLLGDRAAVICGDQSGMTGDLSEDLPGIWRLAWTGSADGGPSDFLVVLAPGGNAEIHSERFGRTEWSWSIHGNELRMFSRERADIQLFTSEWEFTDGGWAWSAIGYGDTELQSCVSSRQ